MVKELSFADGRRGASAALLDVLTSFFCVAYWAGVWSILDALKVHHVISGVAAFVAVFVLATMAADQWLEAQAKGWHLVMRHVVAWIWTCCLAVSSLLIWRVCWWSVDEQIFDPDDLKAEAKVFGAPGKTQMGYAHAILLIVLGAGMLIATGRFRSASHAPPVGIVVDCHRTGVRFAQPSFTGGKFGDVLIDFALTLPVVFVWKGVWVCFDNLKVPALTSAILCSGVVAAFAICDIDTALRNAIHGFSKIAHNIGDVVFTFILVLLVVGVWRGTWEAIDHQLDMVRHPDFAAGVALAGAAGLTCLQRHRSAIFPPVDFSIDDGDHFATVGHAEPDSQLAEDPFLLVQTYSYNTSELASRAP